MKLFNEAAGKITIEIQHKVSSYMILGIFPTLQRVIYSTIRPDEKCGLSSDATLTGSAKRVPQIWSVKVKRLGSDICFNPGSEKGIRIESSQEGTSNFHTISLSREHM